MSDTPTEHVDVLIIGAGLSGIGAGCHISTKCPGKTFAILESRHAMGGTWDLFRYPGIRSDSDMYTLGYSFRPWEDAKSIADGPSIRSYIKDTARDYGVEEKIRYHHRVVRVEWSSEDSQWTVEAERSDTGETVKLTCGFILSCTGYYNYEEGFSPEFEGIERFGGQVVHPQHWPEDLDYAGKRVVVIGSGATAVTLIPAMAEEAEHVTMLQRSPTYIVALPGEDPLARFLKGKVSVKRAYSILRWKNVLMTQLSFLVSRRAPKVMKAFFRKGVERRLPADYDIDKHFKPRYNPWDQRVCLVPDGDLFDTLSRGDASIVTDTIDTFTETGLKLSSGEELEADLVITATGLNMLAIGGVEVAVDGSDIHLPDTVGYKGMMFSGIPNVAVAMGYTNASWTLKCDLVCEYVCRVLNHMDANGYKQCMPREPDASVPREPMVDLKSGYVMRAIHKFPKQGDRQPWRLHQNYALDIRMLRRGELEDEGIEFSKGATTADAPERIAA